MKGPWWALSFQGAFQIFHFLWPDPNANNYWLYLCILCNKNGLKGLWGDKGRPSLGPGPSLVLQWTLSSGIHKVKWCLQEFFDFLCACGKKHPSAFAYATFSVKLCCFYSFLHLIYSDLSVYFHLMYHLTLQIQYRLYFWLLCLAN